MKKKYYIKTFGCQQNEADSERIAAAYKAKGYTETKSYQEANHIIINTCMVRESAENRVYGLINKLSKFKVDSLPSTLHPQKPKLILTGCMVGLAYRDKTGKYLKRLREIMPAVDEFLPIEEIGFDHEPLRTSKTQAWVPVSNGCNNFCTFCVVPFTRGREISRPFEEIIQECQELRKKKYYEVTLLGQNVNSYGADLVVGEKNVQVMRDLKNTKYFKSKVKDQNSKIQLKSQKYKYNDEKIKPIYVKHLGRYRLPTLFPYLLEEVSKLGFKKVDFISSNPWDFSDELINVIAKYPNITRTIHLPIQSGDNEILKKMNRWYTTQEYLALISKIQDQISNIQFTTDIIVGFCGETEKQFQNTVELCKKVNFNKAYVSIYSERPFTVANKVMKNNVPFAIKKKRWQILDTLINKYQH